MSFNTLGTKNPLIQVVSSSTSSVVTCSTNIPSDDTIPQQTEGNEVLTVSITPSYNNSILEIVFCASCSVSTFTDNVTTALFQDSTSNALTANCGYGNNVLLSNDRDISIGYYMTSGTTSSTTFKIRVGTNNATCYVNGDGSGNRLMGGVANCSLIVKEYKT